MSEKRIKSNQERNEKLSKDEIKRRRKMKQGAKYKNMQSGKIRKG